MLLDQHERTLAQSEQALAFRSDHINALVDRAGALKRLKRHEDALAAYEHVLAQRPDHLGALNECGGLNVRLGRADAALACYARALAIAPRTVELHVNKGTALVALNRFEEALASFAAAAVIDPERAEAHYNAGLVRLRLGQFAAGWKNYEWRWRKADWAARRRDFSEPLWLGETPIEGRTILLHAEQGFGDTLQFVRYVPLVARRGANVILECPVELTRLLQDIKGIARIVARGDALPSFDLHCPLFSLPLAFGTTLETIPSAVPYIKASEPLLRKWATRLPGIARPRVGLVWSGSAAHLNDHNRSIPLRDLVPILRLDGLHFMSLQREVDAADAAVAREYGVTSLGHEFQDFSDTAAVVAMLDLVIAVDTSVAHLAGAMGKAVALLLPFSADWRWLLDRTDSPWYPTMRLFRQTAIGDWDGVIGRVRQELGDVARRSGKAR